MKRLYYKYLSAAFCIVTILLIHSCASISSPDGGPYDEEPPKVVRCTPNDKATNTSTKKVTIEFDEFIKLDVTKQFMDMRIPVVVRVYSDRPFDLEPKSPHSVDLIKKAIGITKGSTHVPKEKVGTITVAQLEEIVKAKEKDLNAREVEQSVRILAGTARSMGVDVVD